MDQSTFYLQLSCIVNCTFMFLIFGNICLSLSLSLKDVEMTGDKDDSRSLHITVHKPSGSRRSHSAPLLSGRFVFDDHIRCMAAKQRLTKGRLKARQRKMQMIARLLEMPTPIIDALYQPGNSVRGGSAPVVARPAGSPFAASAIPGRAVDVYTCVYLWLL